MGGEKAKTKPENIFQLENFFSHLAVNPMLYLSRILQEFPGGPVVRTLLSLPGAWVQPLVRELKSHEPCGQQKKNEKISSLYDA